VQSFAQSSRQYDVVVIGGGIVGAGTAAHAARLGLRVALLERSDFAAGTSSASSKLVHGGLRYLRMGDFRLIREALVEARALRRVVAPHLVEELPFVLPIYRGGPYGPLAMGAALTTYGALAGSWGRTIVDAERARELAPLLRRDDLRAAGVYADAQTNDARLTLANVRAAADAGADVANGVEVVGIEEGVVHTDAGDALCTRHIVNATGACVDAVRRLEDPRAGTSVALSKGVHLVLDLPEAWGDAALTVPVDRTRVAFAIPWQGMLLLGTTDTPAESADVDADAEAQVLEEASRALPPELLARDAIRSRFAGLRVLPLSSGSSAEARREVTLTRGPLGMVSVAGGKLTTYRVIARAVLRELGYAPPAGFALPGAADPAAVARELDVDPALALHLARTYGSLAHEVLAVSSDLSPLAPGAPDVAAQVVYAREREWARDAGDVLRRRTTLELRGCATDEVRARVEALISGRAASGGAPDLAAPRAGSA
jgi:glycerol-3-phosphate dehydrogenase